MPAQIIQEPLPGLSGQITRRVVDNGNGLKMHVLDCGDDPSLPCILLLHGFPELAYSWRKIMLPLARAGYRVIAPDQRGYGNTQIDDMPTVRFDDALEPFRFLNLVRDQLGLLNAMNIDRVHLVVGHDFGSPVAAWCAMTRPDMFERLVLMSAPFGGPPGFRQPGDPARGAVSPEALLALSRPRKHYQWYYSTRDANEDMLRCEQGLHDFLRAYYHVKSADWPENRPHELADWSAQSLATMPTYYVMNADEDMAASVRPEMPSSAQIDACGWLPDNELSVYSDAYSRNGFQGGLQWYRCGTGAAQARELRLYSKRTIDVPACFIAGAQDWGVYQKPGDFETMQRSACSWMTHCHLIEGAGHWVQQEQPDEVVARILAFLTDAAPR